MARGNVFTVLVAGDGYGAVFVEISKDGAVAMEINGDELQPLINALVLARKDVAAAAKCDDDNEEEDL